MWMRSSAHHPSTSIAKSRHTPFLQSTHSLNRFLIERNSVRTRFSNQPTLLPKTQYKQTRHTTCSKLNTKSATPAAYRSGSGEPPSKSRINKELLAILAAALILGLDEEDDKERQFKEQLRKVFNEQYCGDDEGKLLINALSHALFGPSVDLEWAQSYIKAFVADWAERNQSSMYEGKALSEWIEQAYADHSLRPRVGAEALTQIPTELDSLYDLMKQTLLNPDSVLIEAEPGVLYKSLYQHGVPLEVLEMFFFKFLRDQRALIDDQISQLNAALRYMGAPPMTKEEMEDYVTFPLHNNAIRFPANTPELLPYATRNPDNWNTHIVEVNQIREPGFEWGTGTQPRDPFSWDHSDTEIRKKLKNRPNDSYRLLAREEPLSFAYYNDNYTPADDIPDVQRELEKYDKTYPALLSGPEEIDYANEVRAQAVVPPALRTRRDLRLYYDKEEDLLPPRGLNYRWYLKTLGDFESAMTTMFAQLRQEQEEEKKQFSFHTHMEKVLKNEIPASDVLNLAVADVFCVDIHLHSHGKPTRVFQPRERCDQVEKQIHLAYYNKKKEYTLLTPKQAPQRMREDDSSVSPREPYRFRWQPFASASASSTSPSKLD